MDNRPIKIIRILINEDHSNMTKDQVNDIRQDIYNEHRKSLLKNLNLFEEALNQLNEMNIITIS